MAVAEQQRRPAEAVTLWASRRNCSLRPAHAVWSLVLVALVPLGVAAAFWAWGASLVLPFALAEVLALAVALLWFSRHATDHEWLGLAGHSLWVEVELGGRVQRVVFVSDWVQVQASADGRGLVALRSGRQAVQVGRFVPASQRAALARELRRALVDAVAVGERVGGENLV